MRCAAHPQLCALESAWEIECERCNLAGTKMDEPLGWTHTDLDARFDTVRRSESNIGAHRALLKRNYIVVK